VDGSFWRDNGLSLTVGLLFLLCALGQSVAGHRSYDDDRAQHGEPAIGYRAYLVSDHFLESLAENWESEFLEMGCFVVLTAYLYQRGSAESKDADAEEAVDEDPRGHQADPDAPFPVRRGGAWLRIYEHSLSLAFAALFTVSFTIHAYAGHALENDERRAHGQPPVSVREYVASSRFWFQSFQNWQSEFLGVASIVVLSVYLRERGSPESKPVATPHREMAP
jgi:hypothetical protein